MKRICIYLTYDKQKIVDRYIGYMLKELRSCVDCLVVVCNQTEIIRGKDILETYTDSIFYRLNIGFDAGGFKDTLCEYIGWDTVLQYDELILVNDSMFGPFIPMKSIFAEMEAKDTDFWGLIKHGEAWDDVLGHIPEHIQSFFIAIGPRMLHCSQFKKYWEDMPYYETLLNTVMGHEIQFTRYFYTLGYTYSTLADTEINDSSVVENNITQYEFLSYELIRKRKFPFLKKNPIINVNFWCQTQENIIQSINYINKETKYDVSFIWENIIRIFDMTNLYRALHHRYIIPPASSKTNYKKIAILVFIKYEGSMEFVHEYLRNIHLEYTLQIFAERDICLKPYFEDNVPCKVISFKSMAKVLSDFSNYDYVCVLHDIDMTSDARPSCVGKSYFYNIWENLIKDKSHISGVLNCFEEEPYLGFLAPPFPNFGEYFGESGKGWNGNFEQVRELIMGLGLNCQLSEQIAPFTITNNFWIRGQLLRRIKEIEPQSTALLPYIWIYLAQDSGYYSGIVESIEYASMNEVNMQYYLQSIISQVHKQYGEFNYFGELERILSLQVYCKKHTEILVYGAGKLASFYKKFLYHVHAYVVTDGVKKPDEMDGVPVMFFSQIERPDQYGIVICLNKRNQSQVIPIIEKAGIKDFFCI